MKSINRKGDGFMEFELGIDAVCNFIKCYEDITEQLISQAKDADSVSKELMDTNWSGAAKEQFEKNMIKWQKQMGKFVEDMQFINAAFGEILNARSVELQKKCDSFDECLKNQ